MVPTASTQEGLTTSFPMVMDVGGSPRSAFLFSVSALFALFNPNYGDRTGFILFLFSYKIRRVVCPFFVDSRQVGRNHSTQSAVLVSKSNFRSKICINLASCRNYLLINIIQIPTGFSFNFQILRFLMDFRTNFPKNWREFFN